GDLVLRFRREIAGVVAFAELFRGRAARAVDHAAALDGGPREDGVGPALDVLVVLHGTELGRTVVPALRQPAVPGKDRDIGDGVGAAREIRGPGEAPLERKHDGPVQAITCRWARPRPEVAALPRAAAPPGRASPPGRRCRSGGGAPRRGRPGR